MKLMNFYEVTNHSDVAWGGISPSDAVEWFRRSINGRVYVSVWNEEDIEEPRLVVDKIDVTGLVRAAIANENERTFGVVLR